ncbi:MAG: transporter substrate-binding domain-containing protein [Oscillospiraceae bacterium]|nr:transporter substrate-binding domain-containing protein [Candidatus Equicaccousia limihippi]
MKKITALLLSVIMLFCFAGCAGQQTDSDYIKQKGKLVVGITEFEPMDFQKDGKWVGFDADMATEFAKSLDVEAELIVIEWDNEVMELDGKSIDCVWNGMTLSDEVMSAMSCTDAYCNNAQVVIVKADQADKYKTAADCKGLKFAVETGSAGKDMAVENGFKFTEVDSQATALMEVASGTSDAAIIDSLMAAAMVGEGTSYANLTYTVPLNSEKYGVGFRKGSDLTQKLNEFFAASKENGTMNKIAEKYGVQAALIS